MRSAVCLFCLFEYWPVVLNGNSITISVQRPMVAKTKTNFYNCQIKHMKITSFTLNWTTFIWTFLFSFSKWQRIRLISPFSNLTSTFWLNMTFPKKTLAQICFSKKGLLLLLKLINKEPSSKHSSKHLSYYSIEYSFRWTVSVVLFP